MNHLRAAVPWCAFEKVSHTTACTPSENACTQQDLWNQQLQAQRSLHDTHGCSDDARHRPAVVSVRPVRTVLPGRALRAARARKAACVRAARTAVRSSRDGPTAYENMMYWLDVSGFDAASQATMDLLAVVVALKSHVCKQASSGTRQEENWLCHTVCSRAPVSTLAEDGFKGQP